MGHRQKLSYKGVPTKAPADYMGVGEAGTRVAL